MQLINSKSRKLISLTISGGLVASSFHFTYNSLENSAINSVITSPSIDNYMKQTNDNSYSQLSIKSQFEQKVIAWKRNTMFMSFADQIVGDKNFKEIVLMGKSVVPYILDEITKEPSPLVWSLNIIFGKTISNNPNTTIEEACKLWVKAMS